MNPMFDVVAVNIDTHKVRILTTNKTRADAEAIVKMAAMRRGVVEEFFAEVPHRKYSDGDKWRGNGL